MSKRIIFVIKENGEVTADAQGYKGKLCETDISKMLQGLKPEPISKKLKPEYNINVAGQQVKT